MRLESPTVHAAGLTSHNLLEWTLANGARATANGLVEWAERGSYFCSTAEPRSRQLQERLGLKELYAEAVRVAAAQSVATSRLASFVDRAHSFNVVVIKEARAAVMRRLSKYGHDVAATVGGLDEECERELETERELEREREVEVPRRHPAVSRVWPVSLIHI